MLILNLLKSADLNIHSIFNYEIDQLVCFVLSERILAECWVEFAVFHSSHCPLCQIKHTVP